MNLRNKILTKIAGRVYPVTHKKAIVDDNGDVVDLDNRGSSDNIMPTILFDIVYKDTPSPISGFSVSSTMKITLPDDFDINIPDSDKVFEGVVIRDKIDKFLAYQEYCANSGDINNLLGMYVGRIVDINNIHRYSSAYTCHITEDVQRQDIIINSLVFDGIGGISYTINPDTGTIEFLRTEDGIYLGLSQVA